MLPNEVPRPDLDRFESEARSFVRRTLSSLNWPRTVNRSRPVFSIIGGTELDEAIIPVARQWRSAKFDAGYGWLTGPMDYGGAGRSDEYQIRFGEVEREFTVPSEDRFVFGLEGLAPAILCDGSEYLKTLVLPRLFRADWVVCQLYSEPGAGSDLAALATTAVREGENWRVNGQKVWTSGAHNADVGLLLTRTGTVEDRHRGITAFVIDMHSPGIDIRPLRQIDGTAGFHEVFLTEVLVSDQRRLGEVDGGWFIAMSVQANARGLTMKSRHQNRTAVASAERLAEIILRLGRQDDPLIRQMWARLYAAYRLLEPTAERLRTEARTPEAMVIAGAVAKLTYANALSDAASLISAVLGPRITADVGTQDSFDWVPFVLQVHGCHIGGGTDEVVKNVLAERGMGLPRGRETRPSTQP